MQLEINPRLLFFFRAAWNADAV